MNKQDVGKIFTTNGRNKWKLVWTARVGELCTEGEHTYHMRNLETGETLTQIDFVLKEKE